MKKAEDGFIILEDDDEMTDAIIAMNENIVMLHKRIKKLEAQLNVEQCER